MVSFNPLTQKIICPFCFAAFSGTEIRFRCVNPRCAGLAVDNVYASVRNIGPTNMGKILTPSKRLLGLALPDSVECDVCKVESRSRVCPNCHFELSHDVGKIDQYIISIIGGSNTGKTHYIVSLIVRLQREVGKNFNFSVRMLGDNTQTRWEKDYYVPLFERKTVLQPTLRVGTDVSVKAPLLFRLTLRNGNQIRALNLTFFDTAGEDMASLDAMSIEARYIYRSNGIVFLLDPWQINEIRQQLSALKMPPFHDPDQKKPPEYDPRTAPENMVGRLRDLFERMNLVKTTQQIKVPVAFTLSKIDTLFPIVEPGSPLQRPSEHFGFLDLNDVQSVSTEIGNYLESWINPGFCSTIKDNFANYHYFGVSSLGGQPIDGRLDTVNPIRVEDPFLWILHELKLIKGKKGR